MFKHTIVDYLVFLKDKQIKAYAIALTASVLILFMLLYITFFVQFEYYFNPGYLFDFFIKAESIIPITILFGVIMFEILILVFFKLITRFIRFYILGTVVIIIANLSSIENNYAILNNENMIVITLYFTVFCKTIAIRNAEYKVQSSELYKGII